MADFIEHLTLISGHTRRSPRFEVNSGTVDYIRDRIANREGKLDPTDWQVKLRPMPELKHSYVFDLYHSGERVVACYLCTHVEEHDGMWNAIKQAGLRGKAKEPKVPWLACAVIGIAAPDVLMEAGDLERCVAWALME
jgi:hypothetical protein